MKPGDPTRASEEICGDRLRPPESARNRMDLDPLLVSRGSRFLLPLQPVRGGRELHVDLVPPGGEGPCKVLDVDGVPAKVVRRIEGGREQEPKALHGPPSGCRAFRGRNSSRGPGARTATRAGSRPDWRGRIAGSATTTSG